MKLFKICLDGLDYMFYRVAKAYNKWDGKSYITSYLSTSLFLATLVCFPIIVFMDRVFFENHFELIKVISVAFLFLMLAVVLKRYWRSYEMLHEKYKEETEIKRKLKGIFVVIALIIPWAILIIGSIIRK